MNWRDFGFSVRASKVLDSAGIDSLYRLMHATEAEISRQPNAGPMTVLEIAERIPLADTTPRSLERLRATLAWRRRLLQQIPEER